MICSNCGNEISDNSEFCENCGNKTKKKFNIKHNKLKSTQKICSRCGSAISKDAVFCYKCGNNTSDVKFDETNDYSTENSNEQTDDISIVESISNPKKQQDNYDSPDLNEHTETNKKSNTAKIIVASIIGIAIVSTIATINEMIETKSSASAEATIEVPEEVQEIVPTSETNFNGIELTQIYTNEAEGISFNYPEDWQVDLSWDIDENDLVHIKGPIVSTNEQTGIDRYPTIDVRKMYENVAGFDLPYIKSMLEDDIFNELEIQGIIDTNIDGVDAIRINSAPVYGNSWIMYWYISDGYIYQIMLGSNDDIFDEYIPIFDAIIESYKITPPIKNTSQNTDDYGLSEEEALAVAQHFIDTHPLFNRTLTGNILYEPKINDLSTKGLYWVQIKSPTGSLNAMFVDKETGYVLLSSDGVTLKDGEEVYEELFVSNQKYNDILFNGTKVSDYLAISTQSIYDKFGPDKYGSDVGGTLYDNYGTDVGASFYKDYKYLGYDGISFLYEDTSTIQGICGEPEQFTYNGVTLNKTREELIQLLGVPFSEDSVYNNATGTTVSWIEYFNSNFIVKFKFENKGRNISNDSVPYEIEFYQ